MIIFPILCASISLMCAVILVRDARRRPRPDKVVWAIAFLMFTLAAGTDAAGRAIEWTPWLARLYYSTGPALVVMFLAIGEMYLLFPRAMSRFGVGITLLLTTFWVALVLNAPIDSSKLAENDGWEAIQRNGFMVAVTVAINAVGTVIIVGGTIYSAWRFWRLGTMRNRMVGCIFIAAGTLAVAAGGSLTRLGHYEYLYIAMTVGVALIFAGVLWTRKPEPLASTTSASDSAGSLPAPASLSAFPATGETIALHGKHGREMNTFDNPKIAEDAFIAEETSSPLGYVECVLMPLGDTELDRICAEWSVPRSAEGVLSRDEARHVWRFRARLSPKAARAFDAHTVFGRRQIAELYDQVLIDLPVDAGFQAPPSPLLSMSVHSPIPVYVPDDSDDLHFPYS